ncbi:unnamed protein product, partial [Vicia faba]
VERVFVQGPTTETPGPFQFFMFVLKRREPEGVGRTELASTAAAGPKPLTSEPHATLLPPRLQNNTDSATIHHHAQNISCNRSRWTTTSHVAGNSLVKKPPHNTDSSLSLAFVIDWLCTEKAGVVKRDEI